MLSIMIIEENRLIRLALKSLVESHPKLAVNAQGACAVASLQQLRSIQPSVVILNLDNSFSIGLRLVERIRLSMPQIEILGLIKRPDHPALGKLLELGLKGLIWSESEPSELYEAIFKLARHEHAISPKIAERLALSVVPQDVMSPFEALTTREIEVALSLVEGRRMPAIARQLSVSPKTVATYKYRIYEKLNVDTEVALLKLALRCGLTELERPSTQANLF